MTREQRYRRSADRAKDRLRRIAASTRGYKPSPSDQRRAAARAKGHISARIHIMRGQRLAQLETVVKP